MKTTIRFTAGALAIIALSVGLYWAGMQHAEAKYVGYAQIIKTDIGEFILKDGGIYTVSKMENEETARIPVSMRTAKR